MKYHSELIEATLLKRPISFLVEVVLQSKKRIMLRCPNLGELAGCDVLGTQLWFSDPSKGHCLPTLELVEVNGGFLVGINPEIIKNLLIEAILKKNIPELSDFKIISNLESRFKFYNLEILKLKHLFNSQLCYICYQHVIYVNEKYESLFALDHNNLGINLDYLILRKNQGHRAMLIFCILHSGAKTLKIIEKEHFLYVNKIQFAIKQGVEIFAYITKISLQEIEIYKKIPIELEAIAKS